MNKAWLVLSVVVVGILIGYSSSIVRSTSRFNTCGGACDSSTQITKYGLPLKYYEKDQTFIHNDSGKVEKKFVWHPQELVLDLLAWFVVSLGIIYSIGFIRQRRAQPRQPEPEQA